MMQDTPDRFDHLKLEADIIERIGVINMDKPHFGIEPFARELLPHVDLETADTLLFSILDHVSRICALAIRRTNAINERLSALAVIDYDPNHILNQLKGDHYAVTMIMDEIKRLIDSTAVGLNNSYTRTRSAYDPENACIKDQILKMEDGIITDIEITLRVLREHMIPIFSWILSKLEIMIREFSEEAKIKAANEVYNGRR
jgi:hypothetical protein